MTKEVTLGSMLIAMITDGRGIRRVGLGAATSIDRFDYGVKWERTLDP